MNLSETIEQPKNIFALRLNQLDRIFETAVTHLEKVTYDASLVAASLLKDTIECEVQERLGRREVIWR